MYIFEESVYTGGEGDDGGVDGEVVFAVEEVVGGNLDGEVGRGVEALLREEDRADAFGLLEVADFEGDVLL